MFAALMAPKKKKSAELGLRFTERLRQLREERNWSQGELAKKLGVQRTAVANYEQGLNYPTLPGLDRMARLFGVSIDSLVYGTAGPEQVVHDRLLLDFFRRLNDLDYRTKAALLEIFEAVLFKEEHKQRLKEPAPTSEVKR